jgi:hypothetical protein
MYIIPEEAAWIGRLPFESQLRFLARLSFELTVAGRNSYEVGTDSLEHPQQLRRVNEIQHTISACLSQLINGTCPDGFVEAMAERILKKQHTELDGWLQYCWGQAKSRLVPAEPY